jgi:uroporphyrinogen-III decarboxylase
MAGKKRSAAMTQDERLEAALHREPLDGIPFIHKGYAFCAKNCGIRNAELYTNPEASFKAQFNTMEQYGATRQPFYTFVSYGPYEFGGEVQNPPQDNATSSPSVSRRPVAGPDDIFTLELPDPRKAGCVPKMMEFARLQESRGTQIAFICGSPFTHAANLCGVDTFMMWLLDAPEAARRALDLMTQHILQVAKYFVDTFGKDRVLARCAAPSESNALIGPDQFASFTLPALQKLYGGVLELGVRKSLYFHICGDHNRNLVHWKKVPMSGDGAPAVLSIGHEVSIRTAAENFPEHIIAGNIEPRIVSQGSPEAVYEASRKCILEGKEFCKRGQFIFMAGCEVPYSAPCVNVYMMQKAVQDFGRYD